MELREFEFKDGECGWSDEPDATRDSAEPAIDCPDRVRPTPYTEYIHSYPYLGFLL